MWVAVPPFQNPTFFYHSLQYTHPRTNDKRKVFVICFLRLRGRAPSRSDFHPCFRIWLLPSLLAYRAMPSLVQRDHQFFEISFLGDCQGWGCGCILWVGFAREPILKFVTRNFSYYAKSWKNFTERSMCLDSHQKEVIV